MTIDDANVNEVSEELWELFVNLDIVDNEAKLVSGSKALHHLLPDLVVPMDRAYTQKFFCWHNPVFQYSQQDCFSEAFSAFSKIARNVNPEKIRSKRLALKSNKDNLLFLLICCTASLFNVSSRYNRSSSSTATLRSKGSIGLAGKSVRSFDDLWPRPFQSFQPITSRTGSARPCLTAPSHSAVLNRRKCRPRDE